MRTTALVTPPRASPRPSYLRNVIRERVAYRKIFLGPFYPLLAPPPPATSVPASFGGSDSIRNNFPKIPWINFVWFVKIICRNFYYSFRSKK
ncbi:hypothetical protein V1478_012512 [Vespula squamosa]|uniref:Uncharacterized protein n=1 Tax=Vespula squamosa TaxID=30214 RepID=A0ABD2ADG1_VESSQ